MEGRPRFLPVHILYQTQFGANLAVKVTVRIAEAMKLIVATIDLVESLDIPAIPCPDVQPLAMVVPTPTIKLPRAVSQVG